MTAENRAWTVTEWAAFVLLVLAHLAIGTIAVVVITFETQGICREPADPGNLQQARLSLSTLAMASIAVWLLALWRSPHRGRLLVALLLTCAWPTLAMVQSLSATPAEWTIDWCLF